MKKILILSDIHLGKSRNSTTHSEVIRQANSQAEKTLESLLPKFNEIAPDLVVHMGDALRDTYDTKVDSANMGKTLSLLKTIAAPTIHLLGNHELQAFSLSELDKIYTEYLGEKTNFFGSLDLGPLQLLWLDLELDENNAAFISDEKMKWIEKTLRKTKPTLVFSHYSLLPIDPKGSFYFEKEPTGMHYKNSEKIRALFEKAPTKLFINAHVHLLTHQEIQGKHFISNPAFSENIAAEKFPENNPGVYSILEIDETEFIFTSYSGTFCFAKIQGTSVPKPN